MTIPKKKIKRRRVMSKRKRMISMVMSAAMAAGLLAGCAGNAPVAETEASAAAAGEKEIYML